VLPILESPVRSLLAGVALALLMLAAWIASGPVDPAGLASVLLRFVHVAASMVWIGFVVFVNFIQLAVLKEANEAERGAVMTWIVPRVAAGFRHASHLTVLTGALLLLPTGYLFGEWMFASAVFMSSPRAAMLWTGTAGGLLMWALVHFAIAPQLRIVLGETAAEPEARAEARVAVHHYARINLVLAAPVILAMVAAAHLG
jgi:uncharacterized membrane protein